MSTQAIKKGQTSLLEWAFEEGDYSKNDIDYDYDDEEFRDDEEDDE